jgi:uncharacterized OB-fold protein
VAEQIPFVDYLVLGDSPHLVTHECRECGARFFDRRSACAQCSATEFETVPILFNSVPPRCGLGERSP